MKSKLLWLDDARYPPSNEWIWVKTADDAIEALKQKDILFASLDHDLLPSHYTWDPNFDYIRERLTTGWMVVKFLELARRTEADILPPGGVRVHSMNTYRSKDMVAMIDHMYGHHFQLDTKFGILPWLLYGQPSWFPENATQAMVEIYRNVRHSA